eukprot:TRINITY_DN13031_c2_g1_i1.p1 TRINITY_DN13031_c2_g1~~TRINITY_DN13031_c2_g1_i1.p1  ORF type:complete len:388 (-),score=57.02 TRINITY_DN13031_c2_g1_i1:127-1176(-)
MTNYIHTLLDVLSYRYQIPAAKRLVTAACEVCQPKSSLVEVGVYSARRNFDKRAAVRETWGRILAKKGITVKFFLGASSEDAADEESEKRVLEEQKLFGDIVRLPAPEGYVYNARKGIEYLRYYAKESTAAFNVKIDDDVYWRPEGLLKMLEQRVPFRYIWGFLDLQSPVPREQEDAFFHTEEEWPDDIFPPYPRGVMRVLSMDIVRLLAKEKKPATVTGDDPSLGVQLRKVVLEGSTFMQIDDRGAMTRFAMEPTCNKDGMYCPMKDTTWAVHHVSPATIRCMFRADVQAGYYKREQRSGKIIAVETRLFPSLCRCVDRNVGPNGRRLLVRLRKEGRCPKKLRDGVRA